MRKRETLSNYRFTDLPSENSDSVKSWVEAENLCYYTSPQVVVSVQEVGEPLAWGSGLRQAPSQVRLAYPGGARPSKVFY